MLPKTSNRSRGKKHEINAIVKGNHFFITYLYRIGRGAWIRCWKRKYKVSSWWLPKVTIQILSFLVSPSRFLDPLLKVLMELLFIMPRLCNIENLLRLKFSQISHVTMTDVFRSLRNNCLTRGHLYVIECPSEVKRSNLTILDTLFCNFSQQRISYLSNLAFIS